MEKADLKRLHTIWFQHCNILEKANLWIEDRLSRVWGERKEQAEHRGFLGQWNYSDESIMADLCPYTSAKTPQTAQYQEWIQM